MIKNEKPLISAIVSTYNSSEFICGKLEDLLSQTIADKIEIVIVNSGSKENEDELVKPYLERFKNIKYIKTEERETIYKAWNRGIRISTGKYITNANTDDRLRQDALEILAGYLDANNDIGLVYADQYVTYDANIDFENASKDKIVRMPSFDYIVQLDRCLVYSQPMWRSSLHFEDDYWFDESLEICGDHEFELKLSLKYKMLHIPELLGTFYLDPQKKNKSHSNIKRIEEEKHQFTYSYMGKYLDMLSIEEKEYLLKRFLFYTKIPIPVFLLLLKAKKIFVRNDHIYLLEFTYLLTTVLLEKLGRIDESIFYCEKILRKKNYERLKWQLNRLLEMI